MNTGTEVGCKEKLPQTLLPSPQQKLETSCQVPETLHQAPLGVNGPATPGKATVATSSHTPTPEQEGVPSEDEVLVHTPEDLQQGLD